MFITGAVGTALLLAVPLRAQDKKVADTSVSVTGCLAQGDERKKEYSLKDADGKTYGLRAGSEINLKAHLGHKVIITGSPMPEKKEKVKTGKPEENERLQVSNLSVVSTTCP
jgi:hypothetical protein